MEAQFGSVWEPAGAFQTPTNAKKLPDAFLQASLRRGGRAGRVSVDPNSLLRRVRREEEEDRAEQRGEEEEESSDSSVESDVGSLLGHYLEIE